MTLLEYIEQTEPQRGVIVELERSEISIGATIKLAGEPAITQVWITDGCAKICWGIPYVMIDGCTRLYTTDQYGNRKAMSCFNYTGSLKKLTNKGLVI